MATTSIFDGTANDTVGANADGSNAFTGEVLWSQVKEGINGTVRTFFDARTTPEGSTSLTDSIGNTWTLQGNAEIIAHSTIDTTVREPVARRSNIVDFDEDGAEQPVSGLAVIGEGEGNDMKLFFTQNTMGIFPLWEDKFTAKDEGDEEVLESRAAYCIAESANNIKQFTIHLDTEIEPFKEDLITGAFVRVVINDQLTQVDSSDFWIGRKQVTLSKEQDEEITLEVTQ